MGFTNNKTDKILEFKNQGIKAAAGTVCTKVNGWNSLNETLVKTGHEKQWIE